MHTCYYDNVEKGKRLTPPWGYHAKMVSIPLECKLIPCLFIYHQWR
nr:MAG TPA: hypothetical protein [Caudoviricetes sp.]DAU08479.1 MAG TPA: hypothetical protein [Caudoviricetes sp.]